MGKKVRPPQYFTRVLSPAEQACGSFDQGAITEQKMIGFAGEGSAIHRIGPLYYWAWAQADRIAAVEAHPHRGFEILSYVLEGAIEHRDTLGHRSRIDAGGLQLMQTGSGMEHEEHFVQTPARSLQIWLDPHFRQEVGVPPRYLSWSAAQFSQEGAATNLLGRQSPVSLVTPDVTMQDLNLAAGTHADGDVAANMGWAAIVLKGRGSWRVGNQDFVIGARDFLVHQAEHETRWEVNAHENLRLIWLRVPLVLPYPLFPKPRS
ncbi:pirin family protein [Oligoflexus tunisiensis]|uniref:pirin family protein n=1 Tax=Oligoflexus tunisiensis TaxID=708132 RepID=UPI00159F32A0|nr:pirin family protein [Oligoflexus tunisiensis]